MNTSEYLLSPQEQRSNLWRLSLAQALSGANGVVVYATGSIIGYELAPDPMLSTLPVSLFVLSIAFFILPIGIIARRFGRRTAFLVGTLAGAVAGLCAAGAVMSQNFWLFCLATMLSGAYAAVVLTFRFSAADGVQPERRAKALSLVMAAGVIAGVIGAQLVTHTMYLHSTIYVATFIAQAAVALFTAFILFGVKLPPLAQQKSVKTNRTFCQILRQPLFLIAVSTGVVAYLIRNFLVTAAPLEMHFLGLSREATNTGMQWNVVAMYAPSFFTGKLIERFGANVISFVGLLIIGLAIGVGLLGDTELFFWSTLVLLGLGWNFGFLGGSAMILKCHTPEEKTKVQSLNDFIIFGIMAIGSFLSGGILSAYGWHMVLKIALVPLIIVLIVRVIMRNK